MASTADIDWLIGAAVAAALTFGITWRWIDAVWRVYRSAEGEKRKALELFYFGKDMNKPGTILVPRFGGIWSVIGIVFGILALEAYHVYLRGSTYRMSDVFAITTLLLLGVFVGLTDDVMGWKVGISPKVRVIASFVMALPLAVVKAGTSVMILPLIGRVDLGIFYSTLVVPIGVMGASNAFNMLAGYNGLEAGMAAIIFGGYATYAVIHGKLLALKLSLIALAGLLAFLPFNWYPAKTFPGNGFTYAIGAMIAAIVIIDNFEKFGVALFLLYFLELALFMRGLKNGVYKENFGVPREDGSLDLPYNKIYSVTHLAIYILKKTRGRATEKSVVGLILLLQVAITIIALLLSI